MSDSSASSSAGDHGSRTNLNLNARNGIGTWPRKSPAIGNGNSLAAAGTADEDNNTGAAVSSLRSKFEQLSSSSISRPQSTASNYNDSLKKTSNSNLHQDQNQKFPTRRRNLSTASASGSEGLSYPTANMNGNGNGLGMRVFSDSYIGDGSGSKYTADLSNGGSMGKKRPPPPPPMRRKASSDRHDLLYLLLSLLIQE